jgi:hypothetical protein
MPGDRERSIMENPFQLVLGANMFWEDERPGSVNKFDPISTKVEVVETADGFGWTAAWLDDGIKKSGKSQSPFRSVQDAKADLRRFLDERRAEYLEARASPAQIGMFF